MIQFFLTLTAFAPPMVEGLRHGLIAKSLREQQCSVDMSHHRWVQKDDDGIFVQGRYESPLPPWIEFTPLRLQYLRIDRVTIHADTDEQIAVTKFFLKKLRGIPTLSIYSDQFELSDLQEVLADMRVQSLYLRGMRLPRTGISVLSQDGLTWLGVMHTQFSNPAIDDLPLSLEHFDATRTRINDEGLPKFAKFTNLKKLILRRTPTTLNAIIALRKEMPWCEIDWQPLKNP